MEGAKLSEGLRTSPSPLATSDGPADERFDEPDVETVESEDEEGWDGWPSRAWCSIWLLGAETERLSWRS